MNKRSGDKRDAIIEAAIVEIANRGMDRMEMENRVRKEIEAGSTLAQVVDLYKWEKK